MTNLPASKPCKNCGDESSLTVYCKNCSTLGCVSCVGKPSITLCKTCHTTSTIVGIVLKNILMDYSSKELA